MAWLKVLSKYLSGGAKENNKKYVTLVSLLNVFKTVDALNVAQKCWPLHHDVWHFPYLTKIW
jgi:hypothetical protein